MIPARMSLADCTRNAAAAHRRVARAARLTKPSPRKFMRREIGFKGADFNRLTYDWNPSLVPADEEIRHVLGRLRARARELGRNNPYVRQYLNLLRVNVIGPEGFKLQAQVRNNNGRLAKLMNDRIEGAWADWSRAPTVDGKLSSVDFQQLALEAVAKEGEVLVRMHRGFDNAHGFAIEAIDPDHLDELFFRPRGTNAAEIRMGVEVDAFGRPLAYHVWDSSPFGGFPAPAQRKRVRIPADEIIHLYDPDRVNQTRGVTWLAPVMYALNMLDGYEEAEITACRIAASAMAFFTRKEGQAGEFTPDEKNAMEIEANPGTFAFAPEGYDLSTWDPQHPNANYQAFVKGALRKIASGLGLSYNVLANDLEGVNYSSMRSGLLIERDLWRSLQRWWTGAFLERVYPEWMGMSLLAGGLELDSRDPRKFLNSRWVARGWPWVDPSKDTDAGLKEIQAGLGSRTALLAEQGKDVEEVFEQLAEEKRLAKEYEIDVEVPQPGGGQAKPAEEPPDEAEPEEPPIRAAVLAAINGHGRRHG